jgi:DNA-binding LytR/AlgR family response regulator
MPSCRKATTRTWGSWTDGVAVRGAAAAAAVALAAWCGTGSMPAADPPATEPDQVAAFMRAKLAHSQNVLEGLAVEDYDLIDKGAQQLSLASEAASWQVLQTEDYARQSADFRRSCDSLRKAARDHNLDGAALAWMEVTMKCVQCHKYVRDVRREPAP